ncbi:hypothetical protein BC826DRAFT_665 [Russula brevipes]|nr:hypothetical protein BC826DRAFT_665 [Russula brevipes]
MPPLLAADAAFATIETPYTSSSSSSASAFAPVQPGSSIREPYPDYFSLDQATPRLPHAQATAIAPHGPVSKSYPLATPRSAAVAHDPNAFGSVLADMPSSSYRCVSSPSPDLRRPRFGHNWSIHPEDLWRHIPSSPAQQPALSSPDVSPDIDTHTPSRSSRFSSVQRPLTLEWACARSAKRRRTNPDAVQDEDGETDGEYNSVDRSVACRSSFSVSEARVPLECYDRYPLDVVRGAVLLLGLRDSKRGLGI